MTSIEWTAGDDGTEGATWNPTTGCDRVSAGCDHCYALTMAKRLKGMGQAKYQRDGDPRTSGPGFGLTVHPDAVNLPLHWRKPRRVFVNSMSDLFHADVPTPWLADIFAVMAAAPRHTFQVLTKRHARMRSLLNDPAFQAQVRERAVGKGLDPAGWQWPLPSVWLGVSAEDQHWADIRIPALLDTPAAVRFISAEPLLGPIDLTPWLGGRHGAAEEPRGLGVSGSRDGRVDDRHGGPHLAGGRETREPMGNGTDRHYPLQAEARGESAREVHASPGDVRRGALPCASSSAGMEALQWADPRGPDGEPQEWCLHGEPARESGTRDIFGTGSPRPDRAAPREAGPVREPELNGEAHHGAGAGNLLAPGERRATVGNRGGLRHRDADRIQDRAGRPSISWVIAGGESGPGARPCDIDWLRSLRDHCAEAKVSFFCKQLGAALGRELGAGSKGNHWDAFPADLRIREFPRTAEPVTA